MEMDENFMADILEVQIEPAKIDLFNKIIEAYNHLALVSTLDATRGHLVLWTTQDTRKDVLKLLSKLPFPIKVLTDIDNANKLL